MESDAVKLEIEWMNEQTNERVQKTASRESRSEKNWQKQKKKNKTYYCDSEK